MRSHLGDHDAVPIQTVVCERGDVVVFAFTLRQRGLCAMPGLRKRIVLFHFLTPMCGMSGRMGPGSSLTLCQGPRMN